MFLVFWYWSVLGFKQTWIDFSLSPGSGTNCSFQQGRAYSGFLSAAAQPAQSAHWVRQIGCVLGRFAMIQYLNLTRLKKKKEETNWWNKTFLFDVWAGAFALSHCPGFQATRQRPSGATEAVLSFSGVCLSCTTDLRNYWVNQLIVLVFLKQKLFFLLGTESDVLSAN